MITIACLLVPTVWWVAPLAAALSFLPAVASYHWVEQPIRTRPMPRPARAWPAAVGIIAVPVALAIGIGALAQRDTWVSAAVIPGLRDFSSSYQAHEGWRECLSTGTLDGAAGAMVPFGSCEWNATATGTPIYLVGDSNAAQFTEAAIGAATSLGRPLVLDAAADCPVLAVEITGPTRTPAGDQRCHQRNAALLEALTSGTPGTVIIANTDMYTWKPAFRMGTTGADLSADPDVKVRAYAQGLGTVVDRLREAGHHVVIVQPVHRYEVAPNAWNPATCTILDFLATGCTAALPRADVDAQQAPIRAAIEQVRKQSGATIIDLLDLLCSAQSCPTQRDGMQLYVDSGHISVPLSQQAVDLFRTAVSS
ncbi:MAG: hypothetical protein EBX39_10405 [Actinobacteria bacterium]|nr:hypothetical protein [Actinomycetota bacterium]